MSDRPEMTDKERRKRIEEVSARLREALGKLPWQDEQLAAEALLAAVGTFKLRGMTAYIFGSNEFAQDEIGHNFGPNLQVHEGPSGGDF